MRKRRNSFSCHLNISLVHSISVSLYVCASFYCYISLFFYDIYFCRLVSVNINDIILSKLDNFSAFSALPLCCFSFHLKWKTFFSCHFMRCALLALPLYLYSFFISFNNAYIYLAWIFEWNVMCLLSCRKCSLFCELFLGWGFENWVFWVGCRVKLLNVRFFKRSLFGGDLQRNKNIWWLFRRKWQNFRPRWRYSTLTVN